MSEPKITPVSINIELDFLKNVRKLLIDQRGNCNELLVMHDSSLGRTTKKNTHIAEMYEGELVDIDFAIDYITTRT